nr:hypothetical protein BaRGS_008700 [Batillaria attramentaria]
MERWEETTCVKFRPYLRTDKNRIRFQNGNGCNSQLGMNGYRGSGLYLHEIGHAIGLVHEHQLPDRDQYIYIIYDNVAPSMRRWFNKYDTTDVNQYGVPFEYSSVMHYGVTAFSKDGYSQTIKARDPSREKEIGRVYLKGLSFSDIKVVNLMYGCNSGCANIWPDSQCTGWANQGECDKNPLWMRDNCKKACDACTDGDGDGGRNLNEDDDSSNGDDDGDSKTSDGKA